MIWNILTLLFFVFTFTCIGFYLSLLIDTESDELNEDDNDID